MCEAHDIGVRVLAAWKSGRTVFSARFTVASLAGNFLFVRRTARFSLRKSIAVDVALTAASWLLVAALPISRLSYVLARDLLFNSRADAVSWIIPVVLSALTGALSGTAVLAPLRQRISRSTFYWLIFVNLACVGFAVWRMWADISAHPAEA